MISKEELLDIINTSDFRIKAEQFFHKDKPANINDMLYSLAREGEILCINKARGFYVSEKVWDSWSDDRKFTESAGGH